MKEFEDFAKAISLGMKALAKIIETAADQLEEQVQSPTGTKEAKEVRKSPQNRTTGRNKVKGVTPEAAESPGADAAPEESAPAAEEEKAAKGAARKPRARKSKRKNAKKTTARARKPSDTETVLRFIQDAPGGVHIDEIHSATGFAKKKLHNIIHRLKGAGKIQNVSKAVYKAD
jgi:hypothetical protein